LGECREKIDELVERLIAEKDYVDQSVNEVVKNQDGKLTLSPTTKAGAFTGSESAKSNARAEMLLAGFGSCSSISASSTSSSASSTTSPASSSSPKAAASSSTTLQSSPKLAAASPASPSTVSTS